MEKDNAIRDQKVFVRLKSVLELQQMYTEISAKYSEARQATATPASHNTLATLVAQKQGLERVIRLLELPINLP